MEFQTDRGRLEELWRWQNPGFLDDVFLGRVDYRTVVDVLWKYCLVEGKLSVPSRMAPFPLLTEHGHLLIYASDKARHHYQMVCVPLDAHADDLPMDAAQGIFAPRKKRIELIPLDLERMAELVTALGLHAITSVAGGGASDPSGLHFQLYAPSICGGRPFLLIEEAIRESINNQQPALFALPEARVEIRTLISHPSEAGLLLRSTFPFPNSQYVETISGLAREYSEYTNYNLFMRAVASETGKAIETVFMPRRGTGSEEPIPAIQQLTPAGSKRWKLGAPEMYGSFHIPKDFTDVSKLESNPRWLTESLRGVTGDQRKLEDALNKLLTARSTDAP